MMDETLSREEELALIRRAQDDPEALGTLYSLYVGRIYAYHFQHTGNRAEAEDLTSRTFYRVLRHLPRYRDQGLPFSAWLFRIAHNLQANWYRDRERHPVVVLNDEWDEHTVEVEGPEREIERRALRERLREVMKTLPAEQREVLALKFGAQMSNAEIAAVLGRTEGAIKSLYHRILLRLREALAEEEH